MDKNTMIYIYTIILKNNNLFFVQKKYRYVINK